MRIIAGTKRGMKLFSPKTDISRPITDRVKESLFSVLYKYDTPAGKHVADLFAGVGSLGLEALSRGAAFVTFVEKDHQIAALLERNIEKAGFVKESKIIRANVFKIGAPVDQGLNDLIFVDPPYAFTKNVDTSSQLGRLLDILSLQLAPDGIIVVRTEKQTKLLDRYSRLKVIERRQWGTMAVSFLGFEEDDK
jgi:16S rRNA (guanine966-N2)-methyltransferase